MANFDFEFDTEFKNMFSQDILGNQLNKTLTIKTPLYISNHFAILAATTVNGVFKVPVEASRIAMKKARVAEWTKGSGKP